MDKRVSPIIGKNVLESLTTGMYENSRFIFREYIQNSADQIDKAVKLGILTKDEEGIFVQIDGDARSITFEDNATGISKDQFVSVMQNVAQSTKIRGVDKGFRGIGRLGGLGYCEKLVFESSFKGESIKSIMTWNAQLLRDIIDDIDDSTQATEVIAQVTTTDFLKESSDEHYFKVTLFNVTNDELLDRKDIEDYLSMVAPVPYQNGFIYKSLIYEELKNDGLSIDEYKIYLNGDQIKKAYTSSIYSDSKGQKKKIDELIDICFFKEKGEKGDWLFWGWYGISTFKKVIEKSCNTARGIRLRKQNIQIGLENALVKLHREDRGNFYFFGEVHAIHPDLIPNSRRDYFNENKTCVLFEKKLKHIFHCNLYKLYHNASIIRNAQKEIQGYEDILSTIENKESIGFHSQEEREELYTKRDDAFTKAEEAKKKLQKIETQSENTPVGKILDRVKKDFQKLNQKNDNQSTKVTKTETKDSSKTNYYTDKYTWLPKSERKLLSRVFEVIRKVLPKDLANNLTDKIDEEIRSKK